MYSGKIAVPPGGGGIVNYSRIIINIYQQISKNLAVKLATSLQAQLYVFYIKKS
jgi:hypothetical protein